MRQFKLLIFTAISCLGILIGNAQDSQPVPKWISEKGYWVVESNKNQPMENTIRFYTNDNVLIYKETISGKKLKTRRASVKMKLKKLLEESIISWERQQVANW